MGASTRNFPEWCTNTSYSDPFVHTRVHQNRPKHLAEIPASSASPFQGTKSPRPHGALLSISRTASETRPSFYVGIEQFCRTSDRRNMNS